MSKVVTPMLHRSQLRNPNEMNSQRKEDIFKKILTKAPNVRTAEETEILVSLIKKIQFFVDREVRKSDWPEIVQALCYETVPAGQNVFDYGTLGNKFYIILTGKCSVMLPNSEIENWQKKYKLFKKYLKEKEKSE